MFAKPISASLRLGYDLRRFLRKKVATVATFDQTVFDPTGPDVEPQFFLSPLLYLLYYTEACNEFAGPISASLRPGNRAPFDEIVQR